MKSPFELNNIRQFIAFRVFFNARFYYPIFTILFLDFGLSLTHFALLNAVWAASIVLLEVPSGALADMLGRRNLVVFSAMLMVIEIALLCFVPRENLDTVFIVFLINRILSGAAEASASGADEALAYDTLKKEGLVDCWGQVLEKQMRIQSIARMGSLIIGAAVYDPSLMQWVMDGLGIPITLSQGITLRFPLYLTLVFALLALVSTLRMREVSITEKDPEHQHLSVGLIVQTFKVTLGAGHWILQTPFALIIICTGLVFDSIIRMLTTMNSQYYRMIALPEASYGFIGSAVALLGIVLPLVALKLVKHRSPKFNFGLLSALTITGLMGVTGVIPVLGLIPIILLSGVGYLLRFFMSHYLNRITSSHQRATVLSFKGLAFNLAYGLMGISYSLLLAYPQLQIRVPWLQTQGKSPADITFIASLPWFPLIFVFCLAVLLIFAKWRAKGVDFSGVTKE
jgi:MFS family permease